ncbi:MAG: hypothetical protein DRP08_04695 [Candidatus Aenigmatarchaeota archaeon]|nr:MAG: hypothetical protein DRP08_04695 [Candidatus Aenigmarchaeota archaeon]
MRTVVWAPGAVTKDNNIDLPAGSPAIQEVKNAEIFRGSDGTAAAAKVAATPTKVDADTIKLNVDTTTRDLLVLRYIAVGEVLQP